MAFINIYKEHIIPSGTNGREALQLLDTLPNSHSRTLFVTKDNKIVGALTYGDIRRGLLKGLEISDQACRFMNQDFRFLRKDELNPAVMAAYRKKEIWLLPVVNEEMEIVDIVDLTKTRTIIPVTAVIMAGGRGERLRPLTDSLPKPMLEVGGKPILEINIDRLIHFGIKEFFISVRYLSDKIIKYFGDGSSKNVSIKYITEDEALGTLGACSKLPDTETDAFLVMNSDVLTNIDYEDFYNYYKGKNASMCVASIPYKVQVPYGIMQSVENEFITALEEKPCYTYYANGGIYLINKSLISRIPKNTLFNATDLMQDLIENKQGLFHYPILQYWLDIGKYEDYLRAQQDYPHINFNH
jgi:dTDP-glucose pyrophosphorylase